MRYNKCVPFAGVAHPVERHLAKVEVASSSLVTRSMKTTFVSNKCGLFLRLAANLIPCKNRPRYTGSGF